MIPPTIDKNKARELFQDKQYTFYRKAKGIQEQVKKGRYGRYAIIDGSKILISYPVYYDYSLYRNMLENKNTAKIIRYLKSAAWGFHIQGSQCESAVGVVEHYALPLVLAEQVEACNARMTMQKGG